MKNGIIKKKRSPKAWVISVDMGYGHQRAAYPLKDIANERIITANNDRIISEKENRIWERSRQFYEFVSRLKSIPIIGRLVFGLYDPLQRISPFFPFRDLSKPSLSAMRLKNLIVKHGLCKSLVEYTSANPLPVVSTFFIPALAYDYAGKDVYLVVTDSDINRIWVAQDPKASRITYFSPCTHASMRLQEYGVPKGHIIETGFPLPKENIGDHDEIVRADLLARLVNLDPKGIFFSKYGALVRQKLGLPKHGQFNEEWRKRHKTHPLTITFAVGGSGAQADIGMLLLKSLDTFIRKEEIIVNLIAGTRLDMKSFFEFEIARLGLGSVLGKSVRIVFAFNKKEYFEQVNQALRTTDVLWTKPSELSFYTALGIPIIIAPPIGAHEEYNRQWLHHIGSGFVQEDPRYTDHWLFYWLGEGRLADAAIQGFLDAPRHGTYEIEKILFTKME